MKLFIPAYILMAASPHAVVVIPAVIAACGAIAAACIAGFWGFRNNRSAMAAQLAALQLREAEDDRTDRIVAAIKEASVAQSREFQQFIRDYFRNDSGYTRRKTDP